MAVDVKQEKICWCQICDKQFSSRNELCRHNKRSHNNNVEVVTCPECGKTFKKRDLANHQAQVHAVEEELYCNLCGLQCANTHKLRRHTRRCLALDPLLVQNKLRHNEQENGCR